MNGVSNPYLGWRYDLGPSQFDRTHNFSSNFIYSIPVLRNSSSRALKSTLGGWQISGIVTIESGIPINVSGGSSNVVGQFNRPNLNGKISHVHQVVPSTAPFAHIQYFNTSFFSDPGPGNWGNLGHNALCGPGSDNWDLSLFKTITLTENCGVQLRLETFNTFNHTQFQNSDNSLGDTRFGQFTSAYPARTIQLAGKFYF